MFYSKEPIVDYALGEPRGPSLPEEISNVQVRRHWLHSGAEQRLLSVDLGWH